jgi:two-component system autoinducer 2 sensor kinase/phosphatase LuxQ
MLDLPGNSGRGTSDREAENSRAFNLPTEALNWLAIWPDGLIAADADCRVLYVSAKASDWLGWTTDTAAGKHLHELLCSRSRDSLHSVDDCPLCTEEIDEGETHSGFWLSKNGLNVSVDYRVLPVEPRGITRRILTFYENRQRHHSHREMLKFAEYVERSPAPIAEFDAEGQLLFGNPALQDELLLHGFDERGIARILPPNLSSLCQRAWEQRRNINDIELKVDDNWYRWHLHPVPSAAGPSVLGYLFDVTEQKQAELRLAAEKLVARRDFFAKMVHEMRTPLNAIVGFSQVLLRRLAPVLEERDMANLRAIRVAGMQLNDWVSDTLDVAKIEAGKMDIERDRFRLGEVFESIQDQMMTLTEAKHLFYRCEYDAELWLYTDFRKVRQILLNLIGNAIKYTPKGGVIVRAYMAERDQLTLDVRDTGIGMSAEQQAKLFRSYEQISEERDSGIQGTGLGLVLVAELVQLLGGSVHVESKPGSGSLFRIILPVEVASSAT